MDKQTAIAVEKEMMAALKPVASKFGLDVVGSGGKYGAEGFSPKIRFVTKSADGEPNTPEYLALKAMYPKIAGKTFYVAGRGYVTPIGWRHRAPKFPLLARFADGKTYALTSAFLKHFTEDRLSA